MVGLVVQDQEAGTRLELAEYATGHLVEFLGRHLLLAGRIAFAVKRAALVPLERPGFEGMVVRNHDPGIEIAELALPTARDQKPGMVVVEYPLFPFKVNALTTRS